MKKRAILEIRDERGVTIQPYVPEKYCPSPGYLVSDELYEDECLIDIVNCEACYIESIKPSPTGKPYYITY